MWCRLAAEQGNVNGQLHLCSKYERGKGVHQNDVSAHMWLKVASANDSKFGPISRNMMQEKMTPADISEAQGFAWRQTIKRCD